MKIKKDILQGMRFEFFKEGEVAFLLLRHGDVLTALKTPDNTYVVRSCLSPVEEPMLTFKELIEHLRYIDLVTNNNNGYDGYTTTTT